MSDINLQFSDADAFEHIETKQKISKGKNIERVAVGADPRYHVAAEQIPNTPVIGGVLGYLYKKSHLFVELSVDKGSQKRIFVNVNSLAKRLGLSKKRDLVENPRSTIKFNQIENYNSSLSKLYEKL